MHLGQYDGRVFLQAQLRGGARLGGGAGQIVYVLRNAEREKNLTGFYFSDTIQRPISYSLIVGCTGRGGLRVGQLFLVT